MKAQENDKERPAPHRSGKSLARVSAKAAGTVLLWLIGLSHPVVAEERGLVQCETIISLEKRLVMERWARPDGCDRPILVRFTDRFLGFACTTKGAKDRCHAFQPVPDSGAFDTSQVFRCVDVSLTEHDNGNVTVSRMREWASTAKQCDWDPALGILTMEVDFDGGRVCVGASCMAVDRLTTIGRGRLQHLVTSALYEFGLLTQAKGTQAINSVRSHPD